MPHPQRSYADPDLGPDDFEADGVTPLAAPPVSLPPEMPAVIGPGIPKLGFATSPEVDKIFGALAKAQGSIGNAEKSASNPAFAKDKSDPGRPYATLADCWNACRAALSANDLALAQPPCVDGHEAIVITVLGHASGQWMRCALALPTDAKAQSVGSAITYARRYGLCALVGIAPDADDDGDAATRGAEAAAVERRDRPAAIESPAQALAGKRRTLTARWQQYAQLVKQRDGRPPLIDAWMADKLGHECETLTDVEFATKLLVEEIAEITENAAAGRKGSTP